MNTVNLHVFYDGQEILHSVTCAAVHGYHNGLPFAPRVTCQWQGYQRNMTIIAVRCEHRDLDV